MRKPEENQHGDLGLFDVLIEKTLKTLEALEIGQEGRGEKAELEGLLLAIEAWLRSRA